MIQVNEGSLTEVRQQLEEILASPFFRTSKRCSKMLRYVVEYSLEHPGGSLKERTIGSDVFDRALDYDTSGDPVVRATAGEIRKRLAQFYSEHSRTALSISLPPGSYVPVITIGQPAQNRYRDLSQDQAISTIESPLQDLASPEILSASRRANAAVNITGRRTFFVLMCCAAGLLAIGLVRSNRPSAGELFWRPFLNSTGQTVLCLGDASTFLKMPNASSPTIATPIDESPLLRTGISSKDHLALGDVSAMYRVAGFLAKHDKRVTIANSGSATLAELRDHPLVLIGGRTNRWTMREMDLLPYQIVEGKTPNEVGIRDAKNPSLLLWKVDFGLPYDQIHREYAVVARLRDPATNQTTVVIAGVGANGTVAGSTFLTDASYLTEFAKEAPRGWQDGNIEIVLETELVDGDNGSLHILKKAFW
jgi:hypothetical protein